MVEIISVSVVGSDGVMLIKYLIIYVYDGVGNWIVVNDNNGNIIELLYN